MVFRVVDYKTGKHSKENMIRSVIRGQKLQLPFYIIMAEYLLSKKLEGNLSGFLTELEKAYFTYVVQTDDKNGEGGIPEKIIAGSDWEEYGEQCLDAVKVFLEYIRKGIFPVSPFDDDQKCEWCEFAALCRRGNQPLRFRLENDKRLTKYREINSRTIKTKDKKREGASDT